MAHWTLEDDSAARALHVDLDRFFRPRSIAVVGASDREGSQAALNYRNLVSWADRAGAVVFPVNPGREEVGGRRCYASVLGVPDPVDLVVILLGAEAAVEALAEAEAAGAAFAVLFSAGFAEAGDEGARLQGEIERIVSDGDLRLLGPNTPLNAFQEFREDLPGRRLAIISQSGHQGRPLYQGQEVGIAVSHWAPTGNEADLEAAHFIRYFADQESTGAVAAYIEGFKDGRTLQLAADHAMRREVPVVIVKVGRTDVGRSWALSHSGHLTGSDQVMSAAFRQYGVIRVDTLDELLDTSMLLARAAPPRGDGVCVYSISGGTGAHMADLAVAAGLHLPELSLDTQATLRQWIADFLRVSNPVDSGGIPTGDWRGRKILETLVADPDVAVVIVPIAGHVPFLCDQLAVDIVEVAKTTEKPICVVWGSPAADEQAYREVLLGSQVPVFRSARNCLSAVKAYLDHHAFRARYRSAFTQPVAEILPESPQSPAALTSGPLSEHASKRLLTAYGIAVSRDVLCLSAEEAVQAAEELGYPCVLKVSSAALPHKSELGLVHVGAATPSEVREAYDRIRLRASGHATDDDVEGVLVSEQATGGVETVVGVARDDLFGPVVMFGLGGIAIEVFRDVTFRIPPFTFAEARRMIDEIRSLPLLTGARGQPAADLDALAEVIMRVQRLAIDLHDRLEELDINPLLALPDGVIALDALAVGRDPATQ